MLSPLLVEPASTKENNCLNAAKACNLNDTCKKYRSAYINPCTSRVSASEVCNKRKCHKALRQFFDKVIKHRHFFIALFACFLLGLILLFKPGVKCQRKSYFKCDFTDFESNHYITSVTYMPLKATVHIYSMCSHFKARSVTLLIKFRWKLCWKLKICVQGESFADIKILQIVHQERSGSLLPCRLQHHLH